LCDWLRTGVHDSNENFVLKKTMCCLQLNADRRLQLNVTEKKTMKNFTKRRQSQLGDELL